MFELYPSIKYCKKYGKNYMPEGRGNGKTRYPSAGVNSMDDTGAMRLKYSRMNGQSAPGGEYVGGTDGHKRFPNLAGLPG